MLSLSLEGPTVRLLESQGNRIVRWHSALFNPALVRRGSITDPAAMAQVITKAMETGKQKPGDVMAAMEGAGCLSRMITLPPNCKAAEFVPREARRLFSLDDKSSFFFWQQLPGPGRRLFVLAVPRGPLMAFRETLSLAGLRLRILDVRPLALARWSNESRAIVISAESNCIVVVVLVDSVPLVMQTHWLGDGSLAPSAAASQGPGILSQTLSYYNDTHKEQPIGTDTPMFLVGAASDAALEKTIKADFGYSIRQPGTLFKAPEEFPVSQYCVNLGLLMKL